MEGDIVGHLPPEISLMILGYLPPEDLWSCLSVNKYWRQLANTNSLWTYHIRDFELDPDEFDDSNQDGENCFNLCPNSLRWSEIQCTLNNWKLCKFKQYNFSSQLHEPLFYSFGSTLAALELSTKIKIFLVKKDGLRQTCQFTPPISKIRIPCSDIGVLLLSKEYLILRKLNFLIVYKKGSSFSYSLQSVFLINKLGNATFLNKDCLEFLSSYIVDDDISCDFSYLYKEKLWISFFANNDNEFHYLINLDSSEVTKINPPIEGTVYHCLGARDRVILEYETKVGIYDLNGVFHYSKEFNDNYLSLSSNGYIFAVFTATNIYVVDLVTGEDLVSLQNDWYLPLHMYINPIKNVVYLTASLGRAYEISAFDVSRGNKKILWRALITGCIPPTRRKGRISGRFRFIYGVYLIVFLEDELNLYNIDPAVESIHIIDTRTGIIIGSSKFHGLTHFNQKFFIKETNPLSLYTVW